MFIFGHIGITMGLFFIIGYLVPGIRDHIKYRYVALGAILPDIIDKLIGRVIFAHSIANGHLIAHTLVFSLFLAALGFYLYGHDLSYVFISELIGFIFIIFFLGFLVPKK